MTAMKKKSIPLNHFPRVLSLVLFLLATAFTASAQRTISGKVTDSKGTAVDNASVTVKNATVGTVTNADGTYRLTVPETAKVLVFSSVGMATTEVTIGNQTTINATLTSLDNI